MSKKSVSVYTIIVGGQAGDGAKEAGINLARLVNKLGYEVFASIEYPSLIKGGHNFARLSFSEEKIYSDYRALDAVIALNQETVSLHRPELKKGGVIFCDESDAEKNKGVYTLPINKSAKDLQAPAIARAAVALGAFCAHYGIDLGILTGIFQEIFGDKAKMNIDLAEIGFKYFQNNYKPGPLLNKVKETHNQIIDGNGAVAEGLIAAGLENYFAYPMTPASTILHYLAKESRNRKLKVIQPENEIAVINMALGSSYAGSRTATGSSGGGFALMLEAMAMAGISETPIVVVDAQRASTSTGVPTRVGQGDLNFSRHLPGEYPRILLAPGDIEEAYEYCALAMNLTWKYQVPVVVLMDKQLSEGYGSAALPVDKVTVGDIKVGGGASYKRYEYTADGISPLAFPGQADTVVKINSYEHNENGHMEDDPRIVKAMIEKRFAKNKAIFEEQKKHDILKIFGDNKSKNAVIFWGSVKGAILEAIKCSKKSFKAIQIVWPEPMDGARLLKELNGAKKIICVENNFTGQMSQLIREKTGLEIKHKILKYDSLPFEPIELAGQIDKII